MVCYGDAINGNTTSYGHDAQGRVISVTDTLGHTQTQTYDANGNVASITNRNGLRRDFTYDAQNRDGSLNFHFTADGFGPNCDPNRPPRFDIHRPRLVPKEQ